MSQWVGGLAEWVEEDTLYLSVAFTYKLNQAYEKAQFAKAQGMKVRIGGPALFQPQMQHIVTLMDCARKRWLMTEQDGYGIDSVRRCCHSHQNSAQAADDESR